MDKNGILTDLSLSERTKFGKEDFASQSLAQKIFSAIWALESEVNNGGFSQYFQNDASETLPFVAEALGIIRAPKAADICSRAIATAFPTGLPSNQEAVQAASANFTKDVLARLNLLDREFHKYPDNLTALLFAFVSRHPEEFGPLPQPDDIDAFVEGSEKLTNIFGRWPSFHDAEVIELNLWRGDALHERSHPRFPVLTAKIHLWALTSEVDARGYYVLKNHTLATIRFHDVSDLEIRGFNQQNVIGGLSIEVAEPSGTSALRFLSVQFDPLSDFELNFRCRRIEVLEAIATAPLEERL